MTSSTLNSTSDETKIYAFDTYPVFAYCMELLKTRYAQPHMPGALDNILNPHLNQLRYTIECVCKQIIVDAKAAKYAPCQHMFLPILHSLQHNGFLTGAVAVEIIATELEHAVTMEFIKVVVELFADIDSSSHFIKNYTIRNSMVICEVVPYHVSNEPSAFRQR